VKNARASVYLFEHPVELVHASDTYVHTKGLDRFSRCHEYQPVRAFTVPASKYPRLASASNEPVAPHSPAPSSAVDGYSRQSKTPEFTHRTLVSPFQALGIIAISASLAIFIIFACSLGSAPAAVPVIVAEVFPYALHTFASTHCNGARES